MNIPSCYPQRRRMRVVVFSSIIMLWTMAGCGNTKTDGLAPTSDTNVPPADTVTLSNQDDPGFRRLTQERFYNTLSDLSSTVFIGEHNPISHFLFFGDELKYKNLKEAYPSDSPRLQ